MRKLKIIIPLLLIVFAFAGCNSGNQKKTKEEIKIGVVLSLTGKGATYGINAKNGMQLAIEELNEKPPFDRQNISLIIEDSKSSAPTALTAFNKLIEIDHVHVAIGFVLSDEVLTCAPIAEKQKIVLLTTAAGSDKIKNAGDYIFRNRESGNVQANAIAEYAFNNLGIKEFAVLHSNSANGVTYKDAFVNSIQSLGGKVDVIVGYNEGKTNFKDEIEKLKQKKVVSVYLAGFDVELGQILKQSKELNYSPQFLASAGGISPKLLEIAGNASDGLICGSSPFDTSTNDLHVKNFIQSYTAHFNQQPDFISANSYDAIYILANLLAENKTTSEQIKEGLYGIKNYKGVGGITTFDRNGEVTKPISLVKVISGKYTTVNK